MQVDRGDPSVFIYDPMDSPLEWLLERGVRISLGASLYASGRMRPKVPEPELIAAARGHRALMGASGARVTRAVLEALPEVRYISKLGIGTEVIDVGAATELGVMVTNTPVHNEVEIVAEHTIALLLALLKQLNWYGTAWLRQGGWKRADRMSGAVSGSTIGIVGLGKIGRAVARRLDGWGARLLATDVAAVPPLDGVRTVGLEDLLRESDVVTLHVPGQPRGEPPLLDGRRLDLMKPGALLVNTARGTLVDTAALVDRLRAGRLAGAALDVFDPEPPDPESALLALPNVIVTPHMAAWHGPLRAEMAQMAFENLWEMLRGDVPRHLVNKEVLERLPV